MLALKRALRYGESIEENPRFITDFKESVLLYREKQVGVNIFHFLQKWEAEIAPDRVSIPVLYEQFKELLADDIQSSSRVTSNGLS